MGIVVVKQRQYTNLEMDEFTSINMESGIPNGVQMGSTEKHFKKMHIATSGSERTTSGIAKKIREAKNMLGGRDKDGY
tara:strand:- start:1268 stop:1501 length:234 start_codon:yes stop_codon:yes gene_type:complete